MPATIEAEGTSPPYMPQAASWPISRKGEPGSSSVRTRSRTSSLPRATCFARAASSPPCETAAAFCRRSSTRPRMRSALARNSSERGLSWLLMTGIRFASDARVGDGVVREQLAAPVVALGGAVDDALAELQHARGAIDGLAPRRVEKGGVQLGGDGVMLDADVALDGEPHRAIRGGQIG